MERSTYNKKGRVTSQTNIENAAKDTGCVPPHALDFEAAAVGAMLIDRYALDILSGDLTPDCFYDPRIRLVFEAVMRLVSENKPVDTLTVTEALRNQGKLEMVGGPAFVAGLTTSVGSSAHIEYHAAILKQKAIQRNLIDAAYGILRDAFSETVNVDTLIGTSQDRVYEAVSKNMKNSYKHIGDVANRSVEMIEKIQSEGVSPGIPSGFPSLDAYTSGWKPSNLIIIGARPSVGKTAFALNLAKAAAMQFGVPVGFFTLEMHDTELTDRLLSSESGIPSNHLHGNKGYHLSSEEWKRIEQSLRALSNSQIYIDETPSISITEFATKAKRMHKEHNVGLIIIDYLQLMTGSGASTAYREQEVSSISRMLKATAKELNIPIIALSQLNRNLANCPGSNGRPMLSDLRESGSIEQDADMVLFVHRPSVLGLPAPMGEDDSYTEVIIAKNRSGKVGTVTMKYVGDQFRFEEANPLDFTDTSSSSNTVSDSVRSKMNQEISDYDPFTARDGIAPSDSWM